MNKLLKDLYDCFYTPPELAATKREIEECHRALIEALGKPERRLVLKIIDAKDHVSEDTSLNSFISGRRFYQRDEITLGFVAKKRFEDHSEESLVVISAPEDWTLTEVTHRVVGKVHKARTEKNDGVNGAMDVLKKLPRPVLAFVIWIIKTLDFFGKVPDFLRQDDPNFATVFLTNLGSIKCPSVYHHLNNYGSSSIMAAIGTIRKSEKIAGDGSREVRDVVDIGFTLDERIADGFYFARSLKIIQHLLTHPELLELPLNQEVACG